MNIETKEFVVLNSNVSIYRNLKVSKYRNILKQLSIYRKKFLNIETFGEGLQAG